MQKSGNTTIIPGNGNCVTFSSSKIEENIGSIAPATMADQAIVAAPQLYKYRKDGVSSKESSEYSMDVAATGYPTAPESILPNEDTVESLEDMLNTLIPSRTTVFNGLVVHAEVETRQEEGASSKDMHVITPICG